MARFSFHPSGPWKWILGSIGAVILLIIALSYVIRSEYLRRYAETRMNRQLKGYTVHIGHAYFHPFSWALDLRNLTLIQQANPKPPVADIGRLQVSVHFRELVRGHLVGDLLIEYPQLYINLKHVQKEEESKVPLKQKGWQDAVEAIYPLKINHLRIRHGDLTYVDEGPYKPLHVSGIYVNASNIRNIEFPEHVYPSSFHLDATMFETGKLTLDGRANFLQEPHFGFKGDVDLTNMDLSYFAPITNRGNMTVKQGTLSAKGDMEYAPGTTVVHMKDVDIKKVNIDYLHLPETGYVEQQRVERVAQAAKEVSNKATEKYRIDVLKITDSNFGYVDKTKKPGYRIFVDHMDLTLKNLTNKFSEGPAHLDLKGKFMGSGDTKVAGTFRAETKSPDFDLNVAIENTDMPAMTDLFRSYGNFDIKEGIFSFYSELKIKDDRIDGYVKPIFKNMKVYDRREYKEKSLFHKLYVGLIGGISKLLENIPHQQVATKAKISGPIASPSTSTSQVIINLIQNAFIKAILPGFEKEVSPADGSAKSEFDARHSK